jgi:CRP-like cAMP-binding protein
MSDEDLLSFEKMTTMVNVEKGEVLFLPADPANTVYLLKKGMVEISHISDTGKQLALSVIGPGEIFGELALVEDGTRGCMARALQNSLVCIVPKDLLEEFIKSHPDFSLRNY